MRRIFLHDPLDQGPYKLLEASNLKNVVIENSQYSLIEFLAFSFAWHNSLYYIFDFIVHNILHRNNIAIINSYSSSVCEACEIAKLPKKPFVFIYISQPLPLLNVCIWIYEVFHHPFLWMENVIIYLLWIIKLFYVGILLTIKD